MVQKPRKSPEDILYDVCLIAMSVIAIYQSAPEIYHYVKDTIVPLFM